MDLKSNRSWILKILMTLILPVLIVTVKPLDMSLFQSIVLGTLFLTVTWWATGYVNKEFASILMLLIFSVFGKTSLKSIFFFPLSHDFVTIIASFILSQGIVNSKVADRFSKYVLNKFCKNSKALVLMSFCSRYCIHIYNTSTVSKSDHFSIYICVVFKESKYHGRRKSSFDFQYFSWVNSYKYDVFKRRSYSKLHGNRICRHINESVGMDEVYAIAHVFNLHYLIFGIYLYI